jgi:hypothetical protein
MATVNELMGVGFAPQQALMLATGPAQSLVAAGSSQATSPQIIGAACILATGAAAGAILPSAGGASETVILNNSGNAQNIYPALGQTINALTANTAISLATGKVMSFMPTGTGWIAQLGA